MLQRVTRKLQLAIIFAALSAFMIALIPAREALKGKTKEVVSTLIALTFWISLLLEQIFFWMANTGRKKIQKKTALGKLVAKPRIGMINFGSSKEASICDITLAVAVALTIVISLMRARANWLTMGILAILLLAFNLHCILNGTTYRYIKAFHKMKKEREKRGNISKMH